MSYPSGPNSSSGSASTSRAGFGVPGVRASADQPQVPSYPEQGVPHQGYPHAAYPEGADGGPSGVVRPAGGLAKASLGLGVIWVVLTLVSAAVAFAAVAAFREVMADEAAVPPVTAHDIVAMMLVMVQVAAYVVTCLWLWRARKNAEAMSDTRHARSRLWVWAGWLVPVVSLWFPYQVVRDVVRAGGRPAGRAVPAWWVLWLLGNAVISASAGAALLAWYDRPELMRLMPPLEVVGALLLTGAFVLWFTIVRRITREQAVAAAGRR